MSFFIHWKAYSLFPRLNNLELILLIKALLLHGLKPRPLLYNGQKSSKLSPEPRVRKLVSQLLILFFWELLRRFSPPFFVLAVFLISGFYLTINYVFSDHYEPGNHSKNQRFHCVMVECTSHEVWSARFWTCWARSIQPKFPEISVQNSMDRFGPTRKISKKLVHLLRWTTFPGRNFGWIDRARCLRSLI